MSYLVPDVKGVIALSVVPPCFSGTEVTMEAADITQMKSLSLTTSDYKINCFYGVVYNT